MIKQSSSVLWECGKVEDFSIFPQKKIRFIWRNTIEDSCKGDATTTKSGFIWKNATEDYQMLCDNNPNKGGVKFICRKGVKFVDY